MQVENSYYIERNGIDIWLKQGVEPEPTDTVLEVRQVLLADEGKVLVKDGQEVGMAIWLQNGDIKENYTEIDYVEPPIEEPVEEEDEQG